MEPGPEQSCTNTNKPALLTIYSTQPSSKSHSLKVDKSTISTGINGPGLHCFLYSLPPKPLGHICQHQRVQAHTLLWWLDFLSFISACYLGDSKRRGKLYIAHNQPLGACFTALSGMARSFISRFMSLCIYLPLRVLSHIPCLAEGG